MPITDTHASHFLELARRGMHPACSGGEAAAAALAKAFVRYAARLDPEAIDGACTLLEYASENPNGLKNLLNGRA